MFSSISNVDAIRLQRPGLISRCLSTQGAAVDLVMLKFIERLFLSGEQPDFSGDVQARAQEGKALYSAPELLEDPSLYFRPRSLSGVTKKPIGRLKKGQKFRLTYPSPYKVYDASYASEYVSDANNMIGRVHYYRHNDDGRPTVICIHCWCGGSLPVEERIFGAHALYKMGYNVALFTMPFHGSRTPTTAAFSGQMFPSRNIQRCNEAFGQSIVDLQALIEWLKTSENSGPVGVMGISLGGYTAALLACLDDTLDFVVPIVAPCSFADIIWHHGRGRPHREVAEALGFDLNDLRTLFSVHCPMSYKPKVSSDQVLIVWGEGDRIVPIEHQLTLWDHFGRPDIRPFSGGHILQFGWLSYNRTIRRWLKQRFG